MSSNIRLSWRNNSTDVNNLAGVAIFSMGPSYNSYGDPEDTLPVEVPLPSFKDAHEIFGLLEQAYKLGRFHANKNIADVLRTTAREILNK